MLFCLRIWGFSGGARLVVQYCTTSIVLRIAIRRDVIDPHEYDARRGGVVRPNILRVPVSRHDLSRRWMYGCFAAWNFFSIVRY
jgi:hypothetical protein